MDQIQKARRTLNFVDQYPLDRIGQGPNLILQTSRRPTVRILGFRVEQVDVKGFIRIEGIPDVGGLTRATCAKKKEGTVAGGL